MTINTLIHLAAASGIVGALLPMVIAVVNQSHWPAHVKGLVTAGMSAVVGVVVAAQAGQLSHGWPVAVASVWAAAATAYMAFWKPTRLAPMIETLTDIADKTLDRPGTPSAG